MRLRGVVGASHTQDKQKQLFARKGTRTHAYPHTHVSQPAELSLGLFMQAFSFSYKGIIHPRHFEMGRRQRNLFMWVRLGPGTYGPSQALAYGLEVRSACLGP